MAWWTQPRVYLGLLLVDTWGKPYSRIQQQKLRSDSVWRNNDREILQMYECVILKTFFILSLSLALRAFCVVSVREHEWPRQYGGRQVLWAKEHHRQSARPDQSRSMSGYLPCICSRWVKPDSSLLTSNLFSVQQGCDTLKYSTWHKTWVSFCAQLLFYVSSWEDTTLLQREAWRPCWMSLTKKWGSTTSRPFILMTPKV